MTIWNVYSCGVYPLHIFVAVSCEKRNLPSFGTSFMGMCSWPERKANEPTAVSRVLEGISSFARDRRFSCFTTAVVFVDF